MVFASALLYASLIPGEYMYDLEKNIWWVGGWVGMCKSKDNQYAVKTTNSHTAKCITQSLRI